MEYDDEEDGEGEIDEETLKKLKEQGYDLQGGDDEEEDENDLYGDEEDGEDDFNDDEDDYDDEDEDDEEEDVAPAPKRAKK